MNLLSGVECIYKIYWTYSQGSNNTLIERLKIWCGILGEIDNDSV